MHRTEAANNNNGLYSETPPNTLLGADAMNTIQEEIATVVENMGIGLLNARNDTRTQLWSAILRLAQKVPFGALDTGVANTYVISPSPVFTAYTPNLFIVFKALNTNTGASTLNVNGLGARALNKNGTQALIAGDIQAGMEIACIHDGTNFQVVSTLFNDEEAKIKGWINFDGTGVIAERDSLNVSGITDLGGVGKYRVTWDTDFANANYSAVATGHFDAGVSHIVSLINWVGGSIDVYTTTWGGVLTDVIYINVWVIGDQ
jgi:hypothetical protein